MKTIVFLVPIVLIFTGCVMKDAQNEYHPSKGEVLVKETLSKAAKNIKDKYNLRPCGTGVAMPGGPIQNLALCFTTQCLHTKEQLRELLIKSAQNLLNQVIDNKEIQPFLKERPFTIKNIQIIIYNRENGKGVVDPQISNAQILQGILSYSTIDPEDSFKYKNEYEESYEEALQMLTSSKETP